MATVQKFMFDLDFGSSETPSEPEAVVEEIEEVIEEEVVPTFSEAELEQAKQEAFAAGKEEGRRDAAEATEQRLVEAIDKTCEDLAKIFNDQLDANREIAREMISVSTAIAKKMFPDLNARNALGEVERVVQDTLSAINEEPRVQIFVNPDLRDPFSERLSVMTSRAGFEGKVFVNADPTFEMGDCRVEWSNGSAIRDSEWLMEKIDEIIERNMHGLPTTEQTDQEEAAPTSESAAAEVHAEPPQDQDAATPEPAQERETKPTEAEGSGESGDANDTMASPRDDIVMTEEAISQEDVARPETEHLAHHDDTFAPNVGADVDPAEAEITQNIQQPTQSSDAPPTPSEGVQDRDTAGDGDNEDETAEPAPPTQSPQAMSQQTTAAILDAQSMDDEDKA